MNLYKCSFLSALATTAYVVLVGLFLQNGEKIFGSGEDTMIIPMAMIMLFVLSAAITGGLVLGRPIMMFLNGQKSEAVRLFGYTIGWLFLATVILMLIALILSR